MTAQTEAVSTDNRGSAQQETFDPRSSSVPLPDRDAPTWHRRSRIHLILVDTLAAGLAVAAAHLLAIGPTLSATVSGTEGRPTTIPLPYGAVSVLAVLLWVGALTLIRSRSWTILGSGVEEFRKVAAASFWYFGLVAVICYATKVELGRMYFALALPLGVGLLLAGRLFYRHLLNRQRRGGAMASPVLVVGSAASGQTLARRIETKPQSGLKVVDTLHGPDGTAPTVDAVVDRAGELGVAAVVLSPSAHFEAHEVSELRWSLEKIGADLVLAPSLTGISGPRVHSRMVEGMPLLFVEGAQYSGGMRWVKGLVDITASAVGLLLISPVLIFVAALIKTTSPGPVFYRQERVGQHGESFRIWKFRSMRQDADKHLMALLEASGSADQPLFKPVNDPRVTRVGAFIRKWSIDELPQLFNVLTGDMSLVGPRPQVPAEVALYEGPAGRRLMSKPGMTGLWQVSGRSDLSWEAAVALDLYYVENWSLVLDASILARTVGAVVRSRGAF